MIQVYTNKENYQYDLHSLIKAFYPERDVKVYGLEQISRAEERGRITVSFEEKALHVVLAVQAARSEYMTIPLKPMRKKEPACIYIKMHASWHYIVTCVTIQAEHCPGAI